MVGVWCVYETIVNNLFCHAEEGIRVRSPSRGLGGECKGQGGALGNDVGRLGHGLGSDLTEWPSNTATDDTVLEVGMIMTLEPGMSYLNKSGQVKQMVHEENIVITEEGAQWLSIRAAAELPLLG